MLSAIELPSAGVVSEAGNSGSALPTSEPRKKPRHTVALQGRFSGRLARKEDEAQLVVECALLGPLLGDSQPATLSTIVRSIACGRVRKFLETHLPRGFPSLGGGAAAGSHGGNERLSGSGELSAAAAAAAAGGHFTSGIEGSPQGLSGHAQAMMAAASKAREAQLGKELENLKARLWDVSNRNADLEKEVSVQQRMITMLAASSGVSLPQLASDAVAAESAAQAASSQAAAARRFAQASAAASAPAALSVAAPIAASAQMLPAALPSSVSMGQTLAGGSSGIGSFQHLLTQQHQHTAAPMAHHNDSHHEAAHGNAPRCDSPAGDAAPLTQQSAVSSAGMRGEGESSPFADDTGAVFGSAPSLAFAAGPSAPAESNQVKEDPRPPAAQSPEL